MAQTMSYQALVARARDHKMTSNERRNQRVSLVMGLRAHGSTLSRERVEEVLELVEGHEAEDHSRS